MTTVNHTIETEYDREMASKLIEVRAVPFTLTLTDGKHRTTAQNKLQHMWMAEIAQQRGDMTPDEARAYCKLTIGVPLLREENEAFRLKYDEVVRPLPYEQKLAIMMEPLDLPVTRLMTTKQKTEYLDRISRHFGEQGIILTMPDDLRQPKPETDDAPPQASGADEITSPETEDAAVPPKATAAASSNLFKWAYADGELVHLRDFARKALNQAGDDTNSVPAKIYDLEGMEAGYRGTAIKSDDGIKSLDGMLKAINAVINGKRSKEQAALYIATEFLDCDVLALGRMA